MMLDRFVEEFQKDGRENSENIANRTLITLDLDNIDMSVNVTYGTVSPCYT